MKPRSSPDLLDQLRERTLTNLAAAETLQTLPADRLNQRPGPKKWSALEAIEHVNRYGDFYVPALQRAIDHAPAGGNTDNFTSSWLGNKFAAGMKPGPDTRRVKTFPSKNPLGSTLDAGVLDTFIEQQQTLLAMLDAARSVDLTATKVDTSLSRLVKLRLGDALRTVIYHNWRHVEQAQRAAAA